MTGFLTDAGLHAEVDKVDVVHYLSCLYQEEAKHRYEDLHIVPCDIVHTNPKALPAMYKIGDTYYERDVFPFILACGRIYWCLLRTEKSLQSIETDSSTFDDSLVNCLKRTSNSWTISIRATTYYSFSLISLTSLNTSMSFEHKRSPL